MRIENTVLFGKYQICRVIGTGRTGCVYLAVHQGLKEYRAIKQVAKSCLDYQQFRREGLILKELRHPGIPIVYDLEEDETYCYLIEEYLEGHSLHSLIQDSGYLSESAVILYGIQICRIVNYLHSAGTFPILHLDLQPKNLLLSHDDNVVRLVDFGHAATVADANQAGIRYGTVGCAAPEQYTDEPLDERTDIYAIGVILHYMGTGVYPDSSTVHYSHPALETVMRTCLQKDRNRRYQSASEVLAALERAGSSTADVFKTDQLSSLTIAFAGSRPGAGTTHMALGLTVYLKKLGIPGIYEEKNPSGMVRKLAAYVGAVPDRHGIFHIMGSALKPWYGSCVKLKEPRDQLRIADYGTDIEALCRQKNIDVVFLVCKGMWWEVEAMRNSVIQVKEHFRTIVVLPHSVREYPYRMPKEAKGLPCFLMPYFPNPFRITSGTGAFYRAVLEDTLGVKTTTWSKYLNIARNICRRIGER